jgi:hypothetical protein
VPFPCRDDAPPSPPRDTACPGPGVTAKAAAAEAEDGALPIHVRRGSLTTTFPDFPGIVPPTLSRWIADAPDASSSLSRLRVQVVGPHGKPLLRGCLEEDAACAEARRRDLKWLTRLQRPALPTGDGPDPGPSDTAQRSRNDDQETSRTAARQTVILTIAGTAQCFVSLEPRPETAAPSLPPHPPPPPPQTASGYYSLSANAPPPPTSLTPMSVPTWAPLSAWESRAAL